MASGIGKRAKRLKNSPKLKYLSIVAGVLMALLLIMSISRWFDNNRLVFRSPVILRSPILIEKRQPVKIIVPVVATPTPTPVPKTEREIIDGFKHASVLHKIYTLESSYGKNDYCRLNGKGWGGFGVMYQGKIMCYESFAKAVERAEYWLVNLGVDRDLASSLCLWNTGRAEINCSYYQKYLSL